MQMSDQQIEKDQAQAPSPFFSASCLSPSFFLFLFSPTTLPRALRNRVRATKTPVPPTVPVLAETGSWPGSQVLSA